MDHFNVGMTMIRTQKKWVFLLLSGMIVAIAFLIKPILHSCSENRAEKLYLKDMLRLQHALLIWQNSQPDNEKKYPDAIEDLERHLVSSDNPKINSISDLSGNYVYVRHEIDHLASLESKPLVLQMRFSEDIDRGYIMYADGHFLWTTATEISSILTKAFEDFHHTKENSQQ